MHFSVYENKAKIAYRNTLFFQRKKIYLIFIIIGYSLNIGYVSGIIIFRWGTFQILGTSGLILLLLVEFKPYIRIIVAILMMIIHQILLSTNFSSIIYNGIDEKEYNYKKSFKKISEEFDIKNEKILLYVGSGFKRKGVKEFLEIIKDVDYNFKAFIIGKEKKINYYKKLAKEFNLENKVIFTGPRTDVDDFYTISDIFLFPTKYEPFGNVIIEAMRFKNVVFTTDFCGGGEILENKFIFSIGENISERILDLFKNEEKLEKIKEENYTKSLDFSIEKNVEQTLKVINEVIN